MMTNLRNLALTTALSFASLIAFAQTGDPTTWKYELKKKSATEYQLIYHLNLKYGWHIWSLHPGGDGFQIVPEFRIDKNDKVQVKGLKEKGKATTTLMDGVDGKVTYLSGQIDYVQDVVVKGPTKITGKHTYQVCDDKQCLAPVDKSFEFVIN